MGYPIDIPSTQPFMDFMRVYDRALALSILRGLSLEDALKVSWEEIQQQRLDQGQNQDAADDLIHEEKEW